MITITDNNIKMIKGDTAYINISFENYNYKEGDLLTLTVKNEFHDTEAVISKTIAANLNTIELLPADTATLAADRYFYDIQLNTAANEVFTVVGPAEFILKEGVNNG